MNPVDRIGPSLPANPLRRVEDRKREQGQRKPAPPPPREPARQPRDDDERPHHIDELA